MSAADELKSVVRYMRAQTERALAGRQLAGIEVPADPAAGRHASYWLHRAPGDGPRPVVFEIHGGGFALGTARKEDALCEWVSAAFDVHVVGIEYRLAPEHPAPAALDDVRAVMAHVASGAVCAADPMRLYALGYSAGADLALAAALASQTGACPPLAGLALHYPFLDAATPPDQERMRAIDLPGDLVAAFNEWYVADGDARNPLISPAFASDEALAALPPIALYPVEGDFLKGQADALRDRLEAVGAAVRYRAVDGVYHGYVEDAADLETYRAISLASTVAERPRDFVAKAASNLRTSLEDVIGPAQRDVPFPGERGGEGR